MRKIIKVCIQRPAKRFVNLAKQDPGRARQNSVAAARKNFSQPRTSLLADLCINISIEAKIYPDYLNLLSPTHVMSIPVPC